MERRVTDVDSVSEKTVRRAVSPQLAIEVGAASFTTGPLIIGLEIRGVFGSHRGFSRLHGGRQLESDRDSQHIIRKFVGLGFIALQEGRFQFGT